MKKIILISYFIFTFPFFAQSLIDYHNSKTIDYNNIHIRINNWGSTDQGALNNRFVPGGIWTKLPDDDQTILYDQGLWLLGKINNKLHLGFAQWYNYYSAGPIINNQPAMQFLPQDSLKYRVYKISRGDNNQNPDYMDWPIDFGAPSDSEGRPKLFGDQTLWTDFNAMDTMTVHRKYSDKNFFSEVNPFPVEIQQLVFVHKGDWWDEKDVLSNTVFIEWTIINKGDNEIDSTYVGLWNDIDFNNANNPPGVDTLLQLGYCWDGGQQTNYNYYPDHPAVGYTLLYGPRISSLGSKAVFKGNVIENFKNLGLSSFHGISDDSSPSDLLGIAHTDIEAWNIARGFDRIGKSIINPITGKKTKFPFDGDPVTETGWFFNFPSTGGGAGFCMFTGPFNLAPNDTQWVMMAYFPALGKDAMESLQLLRKKAKILHSLTYDELAFTTNRIPIDSSESSIIPTELKVSNIFPNPFNSDAKFKIDLPEDGYVKVELYNSIGQYLGVIHRGMYEIGINYISINLKKYASGVYLVRISSGDLTNLQKIVLLK